MGQSIAHLRIILKIGVKCYLKKEIYFLEIYEKEYNYNLQFNI
jgi:hypothetical protein